MSLSLLRYVASLTLRSHRIVAPATAFVALVLIINTDPGPAIETYGSTLALLMPVTIWVTVVALNSEDTPLAATSSVVLGSPTRLRLAKLTIGIAAGAGLAVVAVVTPLVLGNYTGAMTADVFVSGVIGHILAIVFGAAVATLLMSPIVERAGIAFLAATCITLVELIVPRCPPVRDLLQLFYDGAADHLGLHLMVSSLITLLVSLAVGAAGLSVARRVG